MLDALDSKLVAALQLRPRAEWAQLAGVLGVSENTLTRRWARLHETGGAWVTPSPAPDFHRHHIAAIVLLTCTPQHQASVARTVANHREAITVDVSTGRCDIQLDIVVRDRASLADYLTGRLSRVLGVVGMQVAIVTRLFMEGTRWTLDSLSSSEEKALREPVPIEPDERGRSRPPALDELDHALIAELYRDGRESWRELATRCGVSAQTAHRRVERLQTGGALGLRCQVSDELTDAPAGVSLLLSVDPRLIEATARRLTQLRACRLVAAVAAEFNLFAHLWLPDLAAIERVEIDLAKAVPGVRVVDRLVTLQTLKRMGALLDATGRRQAQVPLAAWG